MIRCKHCDDVIESKSQHDFIRCRCGKVAVDGGLNMLNVHLRHLLKMTTLRTIGI